MTTIQPRDTFRNILGNRDIKLFHKWYSNTYMRVYGKAYVEYTSTERDTLAFCAKQARLLTNTGE